MALLVLLGAYLILDGIFALVAGLQASNQGRSSWPYLSRDCSAWSSASWRSPARSRSRSSCCLMVAFRSLISGSWPSQPASGCGGRPAATNGCCGWPAWCPSRSACSCWRGPTPGWRRSVWLACFYGILFGILEVVTAFRLRGAIDVWPTPPERLERAMKVVVVGGGPAGIRAALRARELGGEVTLLESGRLGGTCFNEGPAPVRTLARAARLRADAAAFATFGLEGPAPRVDLKAAIANASRIAAHANEVRHLTTTVREAGVEVVDEAGPARFVEPMALAVTDGRLFQADRVLLAVGGRPRSYPSRATSWRFRSTTCGRSSGCPAGCRSWAARRPAASWRPSCWTSAPRWTSSRRPTA